MIINEERQLVTMRKVTEIKSIPNADNIELAVVDGWQCVVKKGEFKVGDMGCYFEIDSFIPMGNPWFEFLRKDARVWNGTLGTRIRTIKLRGQISQGLLLKPYSTSLPLKEGQSLDRLAEYFGVIKWEREVQPQEVRKDSWFDPIIRFFIPKKYRASVFDFIYSKIGHKKGKAKSSFPDFIRKTDEERIQNIIGKKLDPANNGVYEATCKMDGSSMTVYVNKGEFGHCSRNIKLGAEDGSNFSAIVKRYDLHNKLPKIFGTRNLAIQGELCGPGIQANYEQLKELEFFVFRIWDIDKQCYFSPTQRDELLNELVEQGLALNRVRNLGLVSLSQFKSIGDYLAFAEGPSLIAPKREGVVFQKIDGTDSFKCVSNSYLLKVGE